MLLLSVSVPSVARTRHSQTDAPVLISSSPDWVLSAFVDGPAHCSMGQRSAAQQECFAAASEAAQHEGRKVHGRKVVNGGPEGVVPSGCSYSQVSSAAIFNTHRVGGLNSRNSYQLVCTDDGHDSSNDSAACSLPEIPQSLYDGWHGYRLGDVVKHVNPHGWEMLRNFTLGTFPHTIAGKYLREQHLMGRDTLDQRLTTEVDDALLAWLVEEEPVPVDTGSWCTIHLRLGDVVDCDDTHSVKEMLEANFSVATPSHDGEGN